MLSTFFWIPVPAERIHEWRNGDALDYFDEFCAVLGCDTGEAVRGLREAIGSDTVAEVERLLNIDSTYLFRIGADDVPASPYGSVWLEPDRLLMGTTTREVAVVFREYGVKVAEETDDFVPDHISRELEFLALAWRNEASSLAEDDDVAAAGHREVAQRFFERHCAPWWERFADAVVGHAQTAFFRQAGLLLGEFTLTLATSMGRPAGTVDPAAES